MLTKKLKIFCDGGSRGNPGEGAVGVVIKNDSEKILFEFGEKIGIVTNNEAEYQAVIFALEFLIEKKFTNLKITFYLDSNLVVQQLSGIFKIKSKQLFILFTKVRELETKLKSQIIYIRIPREQNWQADRQVNLALDFK